MANRCQDCNKFVSLENGDIEIARIELAYTAGCWPHALVMARATHYRDCAECGLQMKSIEVELEKEIDITLANGWDEMPPEIQTAFQERMDLENDTVEWEIEEDDPSAFTKKKYIQILVPYVAKFTLSRTGQDDVILTLNDELVEEACPSNYEEL